MSKAEVKCCPRCQQEFRCHSSAMYLCQCNKIELSADLMENLTDSYEDCLCLDCLQKIKESAE